MRSQAAVIALTTFVSSASAFWRMPCRSVTGRGRMDPIVNPGEISAHVHTFHGSGNIGMNTTSADLMDNYDSSCTSCGVKEDHSAYWTPALYFQYSNGTTVMVDQVGGMLAYYLYYLKNVKAFPKGFQMIAGNDMLRDFTGPFPDAPLSEWPSDPSDQFFLSQRALGFNCLNYNKDPEPSLYRHKMPTKEYLDAHCTDGIRIELGFPSCGKSGELDSDDHRSHVAYPNLVKEGNCPEGYDVHYPFLFFETIWATNNFAGDEGQFLLSYGDPTGAGYHGDFVMGWKSEEFLQSALDTCQSQSGQVSDCSLFTLQDDAESAQCTFSMPEELDGDDCSGPRDGLPVNVPIQYGPENATKYPVAGRHGVKTSSMGSASSAPSTFSEGPTVSYSAADPASTSTAQGGIVVAMATSGAGHAIGPQASSTLTTETQTMKVSSSEAPSSSITASPSTEDAADSDNIVATSYITHADENKVIELAIEEVDVTVTATPSAHAGNHKRHLHNHLHHHGRR
ncbi:hypothetical protein KC360_g6420 [Hortaea werneckii]|nr:hypothetical protein KC325_g6294 [Hortaea werneckii]KAI6989756.1 hypothetical protein KC359_g7034 [Hortaea werneckii]KAI7143373.1 hypothetical protein KC344_g6334 [Hortaea werneckii]KAI7170962.1 hypothetical protein KC360_g6420 [Hortaea werneckii]KAI7507300.1 hypothetical protein KC347_g6976 [Hortaea werneckii]